MVGYLIFSFLRFLYVVNIERFGMKFYFWHRSLVYWHIAQNIFKHRQTFKKPGSENHEFMQVLTIAVIGFIIQCHVFVYISLFSALSFSSKCMFRVIQSYVDS